MGCGGSKNCEDYGALRKCSQNIDVSAAIKSCSALTEAQQAKLFSCHKEEEMKYCEAVKKGTGDPAAVAVISSIDQKCMEAAKK